jgi:membrane dipeptidase
MNSSESQIPADSSVLATRLHRDCLVVDGHTDVPSRLFEAPADLRDVCGDRHIDLPRLRAGGVSAFFAALYVPAEFGPEEGYEHALELHRLISEQMRPGSLTPARTATEVREARDRGDVAVLLGLENGRPLLVDGALERFAALGVRYVTLTHFKSHEWCDASTDEPLHGGLSEHGRDIVRAMNELGVLVDASHISDDAIRDALEVSAEPIIASHSSARALCDHPRNLPDDLIAAMAESGGVVMANAFPAFLESEAAREFGERMERHADELEALMADYRREPARVSRRIMELWGKESLPRVPLERYVDHIEHLVQVAGASHVGIGTDFDGIPVTPVGFEDVKDFPAVTEELLRRGIEEDVVRGILGENILRVLDAAER